MESASTTTRSVKFVLSYGMGHVLNDICASMWFTYLMVFFHLVLQFDAKRAGTLMMIGQVADALSTPFVGYFSDKDDDMWICRYGRRKAWHLVGTICVLLSFPFIFTPCIHCEHTSLDAQMVYFGAFIVIFQFGWASVQISHLALIPELSPNQHERTKLTSIRSSFTVLATTTIYVATYISIQVGDNTDPNDKIGPQDTRNFQRVVFFGLCLGAVTSIIFHACVKERKRTDRIGDHRLTQKTVRDFLTDPHLYEVAVVYTCSRLFVNLTQVYLPLYLHDTLDRSAQTLAIVPFIMYTGSFVATYVVWPLNRVLGRMISYAFGAAFSVAGCLWILFGSGIYYSEYEVYAVALLLGFGGSIILVTTLGITADLIGQDTDSGAFIYGCMSFADKLANGGAIMLISFLKCDCIYFYRDVLAYACGGAVILGLLPLFPLRRLSQQFAPATVPEPIIEHNAVVSNVINGDLDEPLLH